MKTIKAFLILLFISLNATSVQGAEIISIEEEIKKTFNFYKKDINESPSSLGKYFSKNVNEIWLGYLLDNNSKNEELASLQAVKSRATFGKRIASVYEFNVSEQTKNVAEAKIIYSTTEGHGPYLYIIQFINEGGSWKINKRISDITKPGSEYNGSVKYKYE